MINNVNELAQAIGTTVEGIKKAVYKGTDCGAWINLENNNEIKMGSIVEGSDAETQTYTLTYPFTIETFRNTLQAIEDEADELFSEANQDDDSESGEEYYL